MNDLISEEQLVPGSTIAKKWTVDMATVRRWRREGMPSHYKGNNLYRFKISEVEAWRVSREKRSAKTEAKP
jgi:phage terminase Nu1 subunit (DNA packaging protein)